MQSPTPMPNMNAAALEELPRGEIVSTYDRANDVRQAVNILAEADFPVQRLAIIGNGMRGVERITGKLTWLRVALSGVVSGAYFGLLFGILQFLFFPGGANQLGFFLAALIIGAGFGMLLRVVMYAASRNRRGFASVMAMVASSYELVTDPELVGQAREILRQAAPRG